MNLVKRMNNKKGQGMTEYIIIVALIAIAAIGVITLFGDDIRKLFGASANALAGETNVQTNAMKAGNKEIRTKGLKEFGKDNDGMGS
ncbi:hypothetical protein KKF34_08805 [Myxococcota bacterium]|nr:hypothetical protein [Myxococcota bacterium]MBU1380617.1 hypothetical protein [Myxococcota bacterium]MBU1496960.1 hypothetical protein [Myxococcota bacterium]